MTSIHGTASVAPDAVLHPEVEIGPFAVVEAGATLARGVRLGPHAVIRAGTILDADVEVHPHAVIGGPPQDRKFGGGTSRVRVGARTVLREFVTVNGACTEGGATVVGEEAWIMAYCHIAHDCVVGPGVVMANGTQIAGHCEIGAGATLGGVTTVHQGVRIGALAMTGASTRVAHDIPPFCLADGHPARLRGLNRVGLNRAGWAPDRRQPVEAAFRKLFREGPLRVAARELGENESPDVQHILQFIHASSRGLTSARSR